MTEVNVKILNITDLSNWRENYKQIELLQPDIVTIPCGISNYNVKDYTEIGYKEAFSKHGISQLYRGDIKVVGLESQDDYNLIISDDIKRMDSPYLWVKYEIDKKIIKVINTTDKCTPEIMSYVKCKDIKIPTIIFPTNNIKHQHWCIGEYTALEDCYINKLLTGEFVIGLYKLNL